MRYLGSFLPDSCGRYLLFVIGGQCLESEPVEETVAVLLVAYYVNTDMCAHSQIHILLPPIRTPSVFLFIVYVFIHFSRSLIINTYYMPGSIEGGR